MPTPIVLYDDVPIPNKTVAYLLLGSGGLVMAPLGLLHRAWWLVLLAVPVLLGGAALLQTRLRLTIARETGRLRVEYAFLGLTIRRREYPPPAAVEPSLTRVAGAERERPSDTWYLELLVHTAARDLFGRVRPVEHVYLVGKYGSRLEALEGHRRLVQQLEHRRPLVLGNPS